ncbi:MAG: FliM/FliN family flagellar motor switch protein [Pseudomonadota bacterium]
MADQDDFPSELPDIGLDTGGAEPGGLPSLDPTELPGEMPGELPGELPGGLPPVGEIPTTAPLAAGAGAGLAAGNQGPVPGAGDNAMMLKRIKGIKVKIQVMLGETRLSVSELANLKKGDFLQLETKLGDPISILANGALIARGEIAVVEDETKHFGITLTEVVDTSIA